MADENDADSSGHPYQTDLHPQPESAQPNRRITTSSTASKGEEPVYHDSVFEESDVSHSGGERPLSLLGRHSPTRVHAPIAIKVSNSPEPSSMDSSVTGFAVPPPTWSFDEVEEFEETVRIYLL